MMNKEGIFFVSRHIEEIQPEKIMGTTWYIKGKWWSSKEEDYLEEDSEEKIWNSWKRKQCKEYYGDVSGERFFTAMDEKVLVVDLWCMVAEEEKEEIEGSDENEIGRKFFVNIQEGMN